MSEHVIVTQGGRSAKDIADEFDGAMRTFESRVGRTPETPEGVAYKTALQVKAAELIEACVGLHTTEGAGMLVRGVDALNAAEAQLESTRQWLRDTHDDWKAMDTASLANRIPSAPAEKPKTIVVDVDMAVRVPQAFSG